MFPVRRGPQPIPEPGDGPVPNPGEPECPGDSGA